jgi:hypothetical protein
MVTGLLVVAAATVSYAGHDKGLASIDPSGIASVSIASPVSSLSVASTDKIYLDSNRIWAVNDLRYTGTAAAAVQQKKSTENMLCFDSGSKFCARGY